jgi:hypothetical protein
MRPLGSTNATPILACPDGYLLSGTTCTETLSIAATKHFACATGYTLDGTTCTSTLAGTPTGYACPTGFTISGTTCIVSATGRVLGLDLSGGRHPHRHQLRDQHGPGSSSGLTCQTLRKYAPTAHPQPERSTASLSRTIAGVGPTITNAQS